MATITVLIDSASGTSFTVPADFGSLVSIEAIAAGGNADKADSTAGGGAYAIQTTLAGIAALNVYTIHIGAGGGGGGGTSSSPSGADTWFNSATATLYAQGAANGTTSAAGAAGQAANCFPTSGAFSGGAGGKAAAEGGGGAAGKNGAGGASSTGSGGQGDNGTGGAGGGTSANGSPGAEWSYQQHNSTITSGQAGSGGGGGVPGNGGLYGAGGGTSAAAAGTGASGCIFFTYNQIPTFIQANTVDLVPVRLEVIAYG
jgi:hypothetical protein